ncbi:MAG TPA: tetratricopeptide repeat protein [Planctomycetota bacterium]|nr:tetratricopeptide repeat protein [Planctomycetota bacterium]
MRRAIPVVVMLSLLFSTGLWADVVHLQDGRKIEGQVIDGGDVVKVVTRMGTVTLPKDQVVRIEKKKTAAEIYKEKAAELADDDAEAHYKLALWCKENRLGKERVAELNKVIEIDKDHVKARAALNYVQIDGKWVKAKRGMVYVNGKWVKPEEAVTEGKSLYDLKKYEDAWKVLESAAEDLRKDELVAEAQLYLGMCAERLGNWDDAKSAYGTILGLRGDHDQKVQAEVRRQIIESSTGGMYLVKGTAGKEDIFSLDTDEKTETEKLTGLQPLTNALVMKIAMREQCVGYIEKGKELLKKAKDTSDGTEANDKKASELLDEAEAEFERANRLVKDVARGYLIEVVKLRVGIINNTYNIQAARVQGQLLRLNSIQDTKTQMQLARKLTGEVDELLEQLQKIQKLVQNYPDELSTQLANCKALSGRLRALKAQLNAFAGR